MTLTQKLKTIAASLSVSLVLVFLLGEIALRLGGGMRLQNDHIILPRNRTYIFGNKGLRGCDKRIVHHKNSLGFRGAEPPSDFVKAITVVAVGGSTTECFYLSDGHSWPEIVGQDLKGKIPAVWVNNAGLDGHSTFGHIIMMRDVMSKLHPKFVLFLVGLNDIGRDDLVPLDRLSLKDEKPTWKQWLITIEEKSRMIAWIENLIRAFKAWNRGLGHQSLDLTATPALSVSESAARSLLKQHESRWIYAYKNRLRTLIQASREAGIQPVFITQPALYGKGKDDVTGVDLETIRVHADQNGKLAWAILELYNNATRSVAKNAGIPLIELAHTLPKSSRYFYDYHHFTNDGAAAVAHILDKDLLSLINSRYNTNR